jgi:two-component system, LuxR family, sensor histidine kinase DctS
MTRPDISALPRPGRSSRVQRALLWGALVALLLVALTLLVSLTISYESVRAQDSVEAVATEAAADVRHELLGMVQSLQALAWAEAPQPAWREGAVNLLRSHPELKRVEWRAGVPANSGTGLPAVTDSVETPFGSPLFTQMPRPDLSTEAELACNAARRAASPMFSRSYFVPQPGGKGTEVMDLCVPEQRAGQTAGFLVGTLALAPLLDAALQTRQAKQHEFSFVEADGTRLARAGAPRGAGVYQAVRALDLPGATLQLRADGAAGRPSLIPNLATGLVLGLSMVLLGLLWLLARDVRRRARAEAALAEALAFRKAMEDSLSTGLRARDLNGAISYVNPAFCAMVGFTADELLAAPARTTAAATPAVQPALDAPSLAAPPPLASPPYWPPELANEYQRRQAQRLQTQPDPAPEQREGFESVFVRKNGERFAVMIYEAPLVDGQGKHTGWMSAVLDMSAQRRVEEISRQQQDRLQATARLATVGEMASLLSHELNQPLAAIASYASGSLNLLDAPDAHTLGLLKQALERVAEQAERAGRVIKSVHDFVRRREQLHESLPADALLQAVLPLVQMQARKSGTRIEIDTPAVPRKTVTTANALAAPARVFCDRTMVEQVLLNLARNGIQAMEDKTPLAERVLTLGVQQDSPRWVRFTVVDRGPGIAPEAAARLFTPFFTTRAEGMGLGLSLCRTVIEQHGGSLDFKAAQAHNTELPGTEFSFTLPTPTARQSRAESGETLLAVPSSLPSSVLTSVPPSTPPSTPSTAPTLGTL